MSTGAKARWQTATSQTATSKNGTSQNGTWIRMAAELMAAGLTWWLARLVLSDLPEDAFRGTLLRVPWVVLALCWIERWGRRCGGRRLAGDVLCLEPAALILLWILTARHQELGLVGLTPFLATAWLVLLAQRVLRQAMALRSCLGRRLPRSPSLVFACLPLVVYLALQPWMGSQRQVDGDEPYYLLIAHSIAYDGDTDLTNNYPDDWSHFTGVALQPQPGDPVGPDGELRSRHSALLPLALTPFYRVFGLDGVRWAMALATACLAWMTLRLGHHYRPEAAGMAWCTWLGVAFAPPLLMFSYQVWAEVPAALLLALALDRLALDRLQTEPDSDEDTRTGWRQALLFFLPLILLPWLKLRFGLVSLGVLALWVHRRGFDRGHMLRLAAAVGLLVSALLTYNHWRYGHALGMHRWGELAPLGSLSSSGAQGAFGLFYDAAFGLFGVAPWWLLLLPAAVRVWQLQRSLWFELAVVAGPYLLLLWPRSEWYGGWAPAFRYGVVFLPLLAMLLLHLDDDRSRPGFRWASAILASWTLLLSTVWVVKPGWTYNFADGTTHLWDHLSVYLDLDLTRFFPSYVRPRLASWLWPAASLALIPLVLSTRRGRWTPRTWTVTAAMLLLGPLALVSLASRTPTIVVQVEDGHVVKQQGQPFPPRWSMRRADYRGGWQIPPGGEVQAAVQPGGDSVAIVLHAIAVGQREAYSLEVLADDTALGKVQVPVGRWTRLELNSVPWPEGARLRLRTPTGPGQNGGVVVDRVELDWP